MPIHYVPAGSLNEPFRRHPRPAARARKRLLDSHNFTFHELKAFMRVRLQHDGGSTSASAANLFSALTGFMAERGFRDSDLIGSVFRASYKRNVSAHAEALRAQGRPKAYVSNRKSLLTQWRRAVVEADQASAARLGRESPFQSALRELFASGATLKGTARVSGLPLATLRRWLAGAVPNAMSMRWVPRLERHFGLPAGTLTDLLPGRLTHTAGAAPELEPIRYRTRLRDQVVAVYAVKKPNERLRQEWADYVAHKVMPAHASRRSQLLRAKTGRWSMTTLPVKPRRESLWYAFHGTHYVASADALWCFLSQYLGWLSLPTTIESDGVSATGGKGLHVDAAMTLANLAREDWLREYLVWRVARSGGEFNSGHARILKAAASMCHPKTGYLTQSWEKFKDVAWGMTSEEWVAACDDVYAFVSDALMDEEAIHSRDSSEPIKHVLSLPNPLDAVADAVRRLDADRPSTGGTNEAIWARNRLLLKLLASNPLRDKNVRMLTYLPNGEGHLRCENGVWRIKVPRREFKNYRGAARNREYDMPVRPEVWPDIERYLREYRPMLARDTNPYVFVSTRTSDGPMGSLGRCFAALTKRYLAQCPGVGPHAMRHIVATSILKQRPNDWMAAAWALHDEVETVLKHYGHLKSDDANVWFEEAMAGPFSRM